MGLELLKDRWMCPHEFKIGFCVSRMNCKKEMQICSADSSSVSCSVSVSPLTFASIPRMLSEAGFCKLQPETQASYCISFSASKRECCMNSYFVYSHSCIGIECSWMLGSLSNFFFIFPGVPPKKHNLVSSQKQCAFIVHNRFLLLHWMTVVVPSN